MIWLTIIIFLVAASPASAQLDKVFKGIGNLPGAGSAQSDARIGSGLQEALKVGTENAVSQTGTVDGFLKNKAIKILMPKSLQAIESPLRFVGYGPQIDEFVVGMSHGDVQPYAARVIALDSGRVVGYQGLARWHHPHRGVLEPETFTDIIAGTPLASQVDLYITREIAAMLTVLAHDDAALRVYAPASKRYVAPAGRGHETVHVSLKKLAPEPAKKPSAPPPPPPAPTTKKGWFAR